MRLVYLSPVPLSSFAQRPHHFVDWFHRRFGAEVLWIDPGPSRFPRWRDWRRFWQLRHPPLGPAWAKEAWLKHHRCLTLPLEPLRWGRRLNRFLRRADMLEIDAFVDSQTWIVLGKPCDLALELCARYPDNPSVFDVMDSMSAFGQGWASQWMESAESQLAARARWILTSSTALEGRFAQQGNKVRKVMNGLSTPPDFRAHSMAAPAGMVLGYVGLIASWFDWDAVIRLATMAPDFEVRLIGPCECAVPPNLPANVQMLPAIAHDAVYGAMQEFSVGLIPFKVNALTEYVDPVKYYEYRAMGLPVLSSCFGEMRYRAAADGVFFINDLHSVQTLFEHLEHKTSVDEAHLFRTRHHWDARFDTVDFFPALTP
jgi:hypothetical protein